LPARSQFDPRKIKALLPNIYLLEHKSREEMIVRLMGTALDEISAVPATGLNYFDICPPEDVALYTEINEHLHALPCASLVERDITLENGKTYTLASMGYPMTDDNGVLAYSIGLMLPSRQVQADDMDNGGVARSVLRKLTFIDIGFGVPEEQAIKHRAISRALN
jgi:hypothetical protein